MLGLHGELRGMRREQRMPQLQPGVLLQCGCGHTGLRGLRRDLPLLQWVRSHELPVLPDRKGAGCGQLPALFEQLRGLQLDQHVPGVQPGLLRERERLLGLQHPELPVLLLLLHLRLVQAGIQGQPLRELRGQLPGLFFLGLLQVRQKVLPQLRGLL
jgi:hypothetical protein